MKAMYCAVERTMTCVLFLFIGVYIIMFPVKFGEQFIKMQIKAEFLMEVQSCSILIAVTLHQMFIAIHM